MMWTFNYISLFMITAESIDELKASKKRISWPAHWPIDDEPTNTSQDEAAERHLPLKSTILVQRERTVSIGGGFSCDRTTFHKIKNADNNRDWAMSLLVGVFGEEDAKRMRVYPRLPGLKTFPKTFISAAEGATVLPKGPFEPQYLQYSSRSDSADFQDDNAQEVETEVPAGAASILSVGGPHQFIANRTAHLPCDIANQGDYKVVWKRGEQVLTAGEQRVVPDRRIRVAGTTLHIANVTASDEGNYTCQLATEQVQEISHTVAVLAEPRITATVPQVKFLVVRQDQTVELECRGRGNPVPNITWSRLGHEMPRNALALPGASLKIFNISRYEGGVYQCKAQNGIGKPDAHNITIKVEYAPEVHADAPVVYAGLDQEAVLGCRIDADPMGNVTWFRNTMKLVGNGHRIMTQQGSRFTLLLRQLERSDLGNYTCLAENAIGRTRVSMELSGRPHQPTFTSDPSDTVIHDSYSLSWAVQSAAAPTEYCLRLRRLRPLTPEEHRRRKEAVEKGLYDDKHLEHLDHSDLPKVEGPAVDGEHYASMPSPLLVVPPQPPPPPLPPPQPEATAVPKEQQLAQHGDKQQHHHDKHGPPRHHHHKAKHHNSSTIEDYNVQDWGKVRQHHREHLHEHHRQYHEQHRKPTHAGPKVLTVVMVTKEQEVGQWREWVVGAPSDRPLTAPRPGDWNVPAPRSSMHLASFVVTGLEPNSRYEAFVAAKNEFGWGPDSRRLVFSTAVSEVKERALKKEAAPSCGLAASPLPLLWVTTLLALRP